MISNIQVQIIYSLNKLTNKIKKLYWRKIIKLNRPCNWILLSLLFIIGQSLLNSLDKHTSILV